MSRGKCEINIEESYPCLYNNDEFADLINDSASEVLGEKMFRTKSTYNGS